MNFDELILDSCQAIAAATSALVKAASSAQRELVDRGLVSGSGRVSGCDGGGGEEGWGRGERQLQWKQSGDCGTELTGVMGALL